MTLTIQDILIRLTIAIILGILIGFEREVKDRPAGLRTFTLVSLGACGFSLIVLSLMDDLIMRNHGTKIDPSRIIEGVITGIGFLGAGTIMQSKAQIKGMTTGASIWVAGAIGLSCGFGLFQLAIIITLFSLFILVVLGVFNRFIFPNNDKS